MPDLNDKAFKKLKNMARIKCWKNICVSDNLREDERFKEFANENNLRIMDGKWIFKNIVDQVVEYVVEAKNDVLVNQEIGILCNKLDDTVFEKVKEMSTKVKVCNILTENMKQYHKLEEEIYKEKGIILNISNNYKKAVSKSGIIINFDFWEKELEKCIFPQNADIINVGGKIKFDKKDFLGRNIMFFEVNIPGKYFEYLPQLEGFNRTILYESFIYKNTNYKNIKKEIIGDGVKIKCLQDFDGNLLKIDKVNFAKTLDKISI